MQAEILARDARRALANGGGLVTLTDLARVYRTSKSVVHEWAALDSFPEPLGRVARSRVWLRVEVDAWVKRHSPTTAHPADTRGGESR